MKLYDIILIILFVATVVIVLWYLLGDSPTLEQGLLLLILTVLFANNGSIRELKVKIAALEKKFITMEAGFVTLATDFKEHIKHT